MFIAVDKNSNRVPVDEAQKGNEYYCPICKSPLVVRDGELNAKHFAHKAGTCPDSWHYDMSDWHKKMQSYFDVACREVVLSSNGKTHRADVLVDQTVLEFQHSPISVAEFEDRNEFFQSMGFRIAWVFDVTEAFENKNLYFSRDSSFDMTWKNPIRVISASAEITDDSKHYAVWLYWPSPDEEDDMLNKVVWTETDDNGNPSMRRFRISSYGLPMNSGGIDPNSFFMSRADYFLEALHELKKAYKYKVKYSGERGKPQDAYTCPRRPTEFGVKVFSETGCGYCRYCYMIASKARSGKEKWAMYCCYPTQVRDLFEGHPGYECPLVEIYDL